MINQQMYNYVWNKYYDPNKNNKLKIANKTNIKNYLERFISAFNESGAFSHNSLE